jgi:hypothetical protein
MPWATPWRSGPRGHVQEVPGSLDDGSVQIAGLVADPGVRGTPPDQEDPSRARALAAVRQLFPTTKA